MTRALFVPLAACALAASPLLAQEAPEGSGLLVLTGLAPVQLIVSELVEDTGITVQPITPRPTPMATLSAMLHRPDPNRADLLAEADAVVTLRGLWPSDPLYPTACSGNIHVVEIDATTPLDGSAPPIARVAAPISNPVWREARPAAANAPSPYAWLGPTSALAMAETVARDLARLSPQDADAIDANLREFSADIRRLKAHYEGLFAELTDFTVYALTDQFAYLTTEFGIYVDGYFLEQDVRWTEEDFAGLTAHLQDSGITTVIHQWQPADPVIAAVEAAGAELVILSSGETAQGETGATYLDIMRANLDALYEALADVPD